MVVSGRASMSWLMTEGALTSKDSSVHCHVVRGLEIADVGWDLVPRLEEQNVAGNDLGSAELDLCATTDQVA